MRLLASVLALSVLSGCQWAVVRYHGNGRDALVKECHVDPEQPNALNCYDYFEQKLARRGPVREL